MDVLIIHYNTPELTLAAVRSLLKHTPEARVTVFDNSDRLPFPPTDGVRLIDNTRGQVVDLDRWVSRFLRRQPTANNWGSAKHCKSVDSCLWLFPDGVLLMDSDVLVRRDVSDLWDTRYPWVGQVRDGYRYGIWAPRRVEPYLCFLNTPVLHDRGICYCDPRRIVYLTDDVPGMYYDTGASLLEDCEAAGLHGREVQLDSYILHLGHASWRGRSAQEWLERNRHLWE